MYHYKISKYNPKMFENGHYTLDEWTEYSDIGKVFNNQKLTLKDYCVVELNYINFIKDVIDFIKADKFYIKDLEIYECVFWENRQAINYLQLEELLKDCLRNKCWCRIYNDNLCICFGYDYYLHICIDIEDVIISKITDKYYII